MDNGLTFLSTNTIVYCRCWKETVRFYRDRLRLPVTFATDWFVEFQLTATAHVSVADEGRARIKSSAGQGLTLAWQVDDIERTWQQFQERGIAPEPIAAHPWGAQVFYFFDPEGHRLEIWASSDANKGPRK